MKDKIKNIHFIGIAGAGMSGIAQVLHTQGYRVSGSDIQDSATLRQLAARGITTYVGHHAAQVENADVVVLSSAIKEDNVEVQAAKAHGIPLVPRAVMLAELMRFKHGIAVAGTHGKTTTTSLISSILSLAGLDPTYVIGGKINGINENAKLGQSKYLVAEADESDASFLNLMPMVAVVTNIEADHMQTYGNSFEQLKQSFLNFLRKLPFYGTAVLCNDDATARDLAPQLNCTTISYGITQPAEITATAIQAVGAQMHFNVNRKGHQPMAVKLNLPGRHNVLNALAAIAVATLLDVPAATIARALAEFNGVNRRFQQYPPVRCADGGEVTIIDDYGHHPTELRVTLAAARQVYAGRRLVLAFQPHRYSRTRDCFEDFVQILSSVDVLFLTEVYAAGEEPIVAADARSLARAIRVLAKVEPIFVADVNALAGEIKNQLRGGDVLLCMGAGSIGKLAAQVVALMGEKDAIDR